MKPFFPEHEFFAAMAGALSPKADRTPVAPIMLGHSKILAAMPVELQSSTIRYVGQGQSMEEIGSLIRDGGWVDSKPSEHSQLKSTVLEEIAGQMERVVRKQKILNFSAALYTMVMPYGQKIQLDRGMHIDKHSQKPNSRTFDIVMATPFRTLAMPDISARKLQFAGYSGRYVAPGDPGMNIVMPDAGQYMGLPEYAVHTSPYMVRHCPSYEEAQKIFANQPDVLRFCRPEGYTRLFATARACFTI